MHYRGGGIGHVVTGADPAEDDDEWMDIDEPGDINLPLDPGDVDEEENESEFQDGGSDVDEEEEEHLGPEDGEGDNELEDEYNSL